MQIDNQQRSNNLPYIGKVIKNQDQLIIIEKYNNGDSLAKLNKEYSYNIGTIRNFLKTCNVKVRNVKESVKFSIKTKEIIIDSFLHENLTGWILGDGGLRICKHGITPYFTYTDKKKSHILYVQNILEQYNITSNINQSKSTGCYQLQTEALPCFLYYYKLFYGYKGLNENGQKRKILPDIKLTSIILKNWFIGDGSSCVQKNCKNHRGSICCKYKNNFILEQLNVLFDNVKCYQYKTKTGICHEYSFNNNAFRKMLDYIGECPVEEYKYKWIVERSTTLIEPSILDEGIV